MKPASTESWTRILPGGAPKREHRTSPVRAGGDVSKKGRRGELFVRRTDLFDMVEGLYPGWHPVMAMVQYYHEHCTEDGKPKQGGDTFDVLKEIGPYFSAKLAAMKVDTTSKEVHIHFNAADESL